MEERDRILDKVRALLAKAESTQYAEEAALYTAKAQELIAAHAIDTAMLEEREGRGRVVTRLIHIPNPYPKEKFLLLGGVARANNCRAILGLERDTLMEMADDGSLFERKGKWATVVGHESDLDLVELLFTSLLVQAVNVMLAHGTQVNAWGENRTKSFRRSFLNQFAWTVRERLEAARATVHEEAEAAGSSALPVLVRREKAVEQDVEERFPHVTALRTSVSNAEGVLAGHDAGQRADIGTTRVAGTRRTLSG